MRVKIAYTVDIQDVEIEVQEIMNKAVNNLEEACKKALFIENSLGKLDVSIDNLLEELKNARELMYRVDSVLSDSHDILDGYNNVLKKMEEETLQEVEEEENDEDI